MTKIRQLPYKIRSLEIEFSTPHQQAEQYWDYFLSTELGQLFQSIPWDELCGQFQHRRDSRGKKGSFETRGKLALQFLKHYSQLSDADLMERLRTDYAYQFFCGVYFRPTDEIPGFKIISDIRCELAEKFDLKKRKELQKVFARHWSPYMENTHVSLTDATAYESYIRYPTSVKILWESCDWIYGQIKRVNKCMKGRMPRSKYAEIKDRYLNYQRNRKKTWKKANKLIGSLLYLLHKLNGQLQEMEEKSASTLIFGKRYKKRSNTITKVYLQQKRLYETGEQSKGMIVSIDKDFLRPIVRGKENKRVEFGAKVNMLQVDGINFIEHFSYNAFNEGIRLIQTIWLHRELFGKCTHIAADRIYATNKNRTYCRENKIITNFIPKGKMAEHYEQQTMQIKSIMSRERATRMEGSFGTEKNHYTLHRVKARRVDTEELWIFFGVHTANAARIAPRIALSKLRAQKAA
ncbi:MAG: transposase [Sphingobacteriales bacterium]|nr:transposase [Sphingobacteriales bacterium]